MRVLLMAAMTIDGKIARDKHEVIDWSSPEDKSMFMRVSRESGVLIMGRNTYETLKQPLPGRLHIVLTHRTSSQPALEQVEFTSAPPAVILDDLARRGYQTVILAGGAEANRTLSTPGWWTSCG